MTFQKVQFGTQIIKMNSKNLTKQLKFLKTLVKKTNRLRLK